MGQAHFENFNFLVKVKSPLGQSIFFLTFFFFFLKAFQTESNFQVSQTGLDLDKVVKPVEDNVIGDATLSVWRMQRACSVADA